MALAQTIFRIKTIQQFLLGKGKRGATYNEIENYLKEESSHNSMGDISFSKRTFLRDKELLSNEFYTDISVTKDNRYFIDVESTFGDDEDVFDNILLVEALKKAKFNRKIMHYEARRSRGLKHLNGLIYAIKEKRIIKFLYISFYSNQSDYSEVVVEPYALKEFKYRWYLLGRNRENNKIHAFALDRMKDIEITKSKNRAETINVEEMFENVFGIEFPNGEEPQKIRLKVDQQQGKYLKTVPIHHSQTVIEDNTQHFIFELFLTPNYAFYQELFSLMDRVEVISPQEVKDEMIEFCERMLSNLRNNAIS